ncbi:methyltransferase domain-containing protein [Rhodopirellula sp.]|nr:methyltransferase domain-containing protein [Rhodopirellula sp.]
MTGSFDVDVSRTSIPSNKTDSAVRARPPRPPVLPRTLGPVPDLERHLPADWWRTLFNSIYLKTDGDVVENDANTVHEVDALVHAVGLEINDRVLDLCCGQGRHCLELAKRGFRNVVGVDRSRYLIRLARRRAKQKSLEVSFHEGDARKFRLQENDFHCVALMGNSFGYFDREEDDLTVLSAVKRALTPGGVLALDIVNGDWMRQNFVPRNWEWIDQDHLVCRERSISSDKQRLISREVVVHAERGVIVDQFYAERLYSRDGIVHLLEQAGFTDLREHTTLQAESDRNYDLGMMAHRMLLTAKSPKMHSKPRGSKPAFTEVTVLLGDPRLPDTCKRDGQFNTEDFETIKRLKEALGELTNYSFRYLDNHASLWPDLRGSRPGFVLNLCDEGLDNDAFKELHVPAMLETMSVPYNGAGPACLGLCYNKSQVRSIAEGMDVPVPLESYVDPDDQSATIPSILPALLKPVYGDSSVGITAASVVDSPAELLSRFETMRNEFPGLPLLIQEYLTGKEYSVGVIGNPGLGYQFLPILEVDYSGLDEGLPKILGYESKWLPDSPYWTQIKYHEADLDDDTTRRLYDDSSLLFERLGCRDYARFDYRADANGTIKLLEANPNPGWCWDGKFNYMAGYAGMRYADLLLAILEAAQARCSNQLKPI